MYICLFADACTPRLQRSKGSSRARRQSCSSPARRAGSETPFRNHLENMVDSDQQVVKKKLFEREFFIDNLLVRIHHIFWIILVDRPCAMGV